MSSNVVVVNVIVGVHDNEIPVSLLSDNQREVLRTQGFSDVKQLINAADLVEKSVRAALQSAS